MSREFRRKRGHKRRTEQVTVGVWVRSLDSVENEKGEVVERGIGWSVTVKRVLGEFRWGDGRDEDELRVGNGAPYSEDRYKLDRVGSLR